MKRKILCLLLVIFYASSCGNGKQENKVDLEELTREKLTELSELGTVSYTVTKIVKGSQEQKKGILGKKNILYALNATLKAGIDMKDIPKENVNIDLTKKQIKLIIPHAKLLDINIPPSEIEKIEENTGWLRKKFTHIEKEEILKRGQQDIMNDLSKIGILNDAEKNAKVFLVNLLKNLGYSDVIVEFKG